MTMLRINFLFLFCLTLYFAQAQTAIENFAKKQISKSKGKAQIGEVHKKYMKKIVFSQEKISVDAPNEATFVNSAKLGERLFFRTYWEKPLEDAFKGEFSDNAVLNSAELYKVFINNELAAEHIENSLTRTEAAIAWYGTWGLLLHEKETSKEFIYNNCLQKALQKKSSRLKEGSVSIRIENYLYNITANKAGSLLASGEITLNISAEDLSKFRQDFPAVAQRYPECMPTPKQKDEALEAELLQVVKDKGWQEEHKHLVIMDKDFVIVRDNYTKEIADRSLQVAVGARKSGKCWYQTFVLFQQYAGGGNYEKAFKVSMNRVGEQVPVPCSCLFE